MQKRSTTNYTEAMSKEEIELRIKRMMCLFLDSIRDYESENDEPISNDERQSSEFVDLFIESEDAFDYVEILKHYNHE